MRQPYMCTREAQDVRPISSSLIGDLPYLEWSLVSINLLASSNFGVFWGECVVTSSSAEVSEERA